METAISELASAIRFACVCGIFIALLSFVAGVIRYAIVSSTVINLLKSGQGPVARVSDADQQPQPHD